MFYVVCYQSVTRNSNNISGYVYNREFITKILNLTVGFFLKLMYLVFLSKI